MGNTILLNKAAPVEEWLSMSNLGTDCFFELLVNVSDGMEMTNDQKLLIEFIANQKEINNVAAGTAGFEIEEDMPWGKRTLQEDKQFMLKLIEKAKDPESWKNLDYIPNADIVVPWLDKFADMIKKVKT